MGPTRSEIIRVRSDRRQLLVAGLVVAGLILTGCTGKTDGEASRSQTPIPEPVLPMFRVDSEPLWGTDAVDIGDIGEIRIRGQTAVVSGLGISEGESVTIAAVDAATGSPLWSLDTLDDLSGGDGAVLWSSRFLLDESTEAPVLVEYYSDPCESPLGLCPPGSVVLTADRGIAALSPQDGTVLWKYPAVPPVEADSEQAMKCATPTCTW